MGEGRGSVPVANALGSGSSTIQMRGRGTPAAIAISSTTLTSCRSWSLLGSTTSRAPVDHSTFSGPGREGVPRERGGGERQADAEPGKDVVIRVMGRGARVEVIDVVAAEPEPREEGHEAHHEHGGPAAIGFLLLEEVQRRCVAHVFGFKERSTCGTAFSPWSSIS